MQNFNYSIPTKVFFGKDQINVLGGEIKKYGSRVLITYGGGSIKKNGIYDKVVEILKANHIEYWELGGIEPNPEIGKIREGVQICKDNNIDFVLAVGGGSTIDSAKIISVAYYYEGDPKGAYLQDRLAESILKTCIKYGKIAIDEPENYEARANIMWAASLALNGILSYGKNTASSVHGIAQYVSAYYNTTHGVALAILTPVWMEYVLEDKTVEKFVEYGVNVWGISPDKDKFAIAQEAIDKTKEYFTSLGLPSTLGEVGIGEENLENMARDAIENKGGVIGNFKPLYYEDVLEIYRRAT